jgi:AcrR family transcriptional regulator
MVEPSGTKQRIQAVARELFAQKGVRDTSLKEIADRLEITKPALYYHFASRDELVRSIVQPIIDGGEAFLRRQEAIGDIEPRVLLEDYFDYCHRHRNEVMLLFSEPNVLAEHEVVETVMAWRTRLMALLFPPKPTLAQAARAVVALGGIHDCTIQFPDVPVDVLRLPTVHAACGALGTSP